MNTDVHWLLEPEVFQNDMAPFIEALINLQIPHTICKFGKSYEEYLTTPELNDPQTKVVFHGSLQFAKLIKQNKNWHVF